MSSAETSYLPCRYGEVPILLPYYYHYQLNTAYFLSLRRLDLVQRVLSKLISLLAFARQILLEVVPANLVHPVLDHVSRT